MGKPLISIIVPIYNVEAFLDECLTSIVEQTSNNFVALLINDGSKDNSVAIAEQYVEKHPDIFKLYHKPNGGLSDARNFGIEKASSNYVMFLDSDDVIAKNTIEVVTNSIKETPVEVLCFGMTEISEQGHHIRNIPPSIGNQKTTSLDESPELITQALPNACNKVIRTTLFTDNDIAFPKGLWYEDLATSPRLYSKAKAIAFIGDNLYHYRTREGSITQTISPKILDMVTVLSSLDRYFTEQVKGGYEQQLLSLKLNMLMKTLVRIAASNDTVQQKALLKELRAYLKESMPSATGVMRIKGKLIYRFTVMLASLNMNTLLVLFLKTCLKKGLVRA